MNDGFWNTMIAIVVALALAAATFSVAQCTVKTNTNYYQAQTECVQQGGSFVPTGNNGHTMCLHK